MERKFNMGLFVSIVIVILINCSSLREGKQDEADPEGLIVQEGLLAIFDDAKVNYGDYQVVIFYPLKDKEDSLTSDNFKKLKYDTGFLLGSFSRKLKRELLEDFGISGLLEPSLGYKVLPVKIEYEIGNLYYEDASLTKLQSHGDMLQKVFYSRDASVEFRRLVWAK